MPTMVPVYTVHHGVVLPVEGINLRKHVHYIFRQKLNGKPVGCNHAYVDSCSGTECSVSILPLGPSITECMYTGKRPSLWALTVSLFWSTHTTSSETLVSFRAMCICIRKQGGHKVEKKNSEFCRLFQSHKLTFPQVIATKSKCN